ncbi:energy transducer TonB [Flavobacterium sp. GSP27]|uniref:energy transducer TonB n=1 Tax=unclassified Flavobacterium TaxID=196869 RepID=UPI000F84C8DB|nr:MULTISPECIES: energy transducer TonB [unclassified Flavobacterium]RTY93489.1 energy transducer TonB [Flavobacterium sp. GSN2]RTY64112.1 energy transducer TonB [Flavobacterium sp. LB2P53]RTY75926.1 energy transducer TonB [Flavobacterium sp. LS1R10]RTY80887.1 energy transducer TonB [Flavobacterium sp. LS1P28]RTY82855.1 energy transducer TonB [Flavobacterium sp. ZB4P23]
MKLDIFKNQWLDIVFEGRNKSYGAYELRKENNKTSVRALIVGSILFSLAVSAPLIASLLPDTSDVEENRDIKITAVKLPPKQEKPKENIPPPPPPPPKVDQVKFVKPVVAKAEEVTEEPPKIVEIKDKKLGAVTIKGDPDAVLTVEPVGTGTAAVVEEVDNQIYNTAGIEVKPDFPGGIEKFYKYVGNNYQTPEEDGLNGKVYVTFVVEKDGSLTDIKVIRDIGYGTGKEAIRVLKKSPRWTPGEQNGKKVRVLYSLPITIQTAN